MTALVFLIAILIILASGFALYVGLRFPDRVDEGRVRSDGFRRTGHVSRETLRRLRDDLNAEELPLTRTRTRIVGVPIGDGCVNDTGIDE